MIRLTERSQRDRRPPTTTRRQARATEAIAATICALALWSLITAAAAAAYVFLGLGCTRGLACFGG